MMKMFAYLSTICYNIKDCGQMYVPETTEKHIIFNTVFLQRMSFLFYPAF